MPVGGATGGVAEPGPSGPPSGEQERVEKERKPAGHLCDLGIIFSILEGFIILDSGVGVLYWTWCTVGVLKKTASYQPSKIAHRSIIFSPSIHIGARATPWQPLNANAPTKAMQRCRRRSYLAHAAAGHGTSHHLEAWRGGSSRPPP